MKLKTLVVDANVAIKWFIPEIHSTAASRILRFKGELLAPDLIWVEVANVLWKKTQRQEIEAKEAQGILKEFTRFPLQTFPSKFLVQAALELAHGASISVYDGPYLALANHHDSAFVTADRKFYDVVKKKYPQSSITWIEDIK